MPPVLRPAKLVINVFSLLATVIELLIAPKLSPETELLYCFRLVAILLTLKRLIPLVSRPERLAMNDLNLFAEEIDE